MRFERSESGTVPITSAASSLAQSGSDSCANRMESESGKFDLRNSDCTAARRAEEEEGEGVPVGATAATTEAPVGFRLSALEPKVRELSESEPNTAAVIEAATWRCVRRGSPPVVREWATASARMVLTSLMASLVVSSVCLAQP